MMKKEENNKNIISETNLSILFIAFVGRYFGFVIFLGGLIIKNKRKKNKYKAFIIFMWK